MTEDMRESRGRSPGSIVAMLLLPFRSHLPLSNFFWKGALCCITNVCPWAPPWPHATQSPLLKGFLSRLKPGFMLFLFKTLKQFHLWWEDEKYEEEGYDDDFCGGSLPSGNLSSKLSTHFSTQSPPEHMRPSCVSIEISKCSSIGSLSESLQRDEWDYPCTHTKSSTF